MQVIPPTKWNPRKRGYDLDTINVDIPAPIHQVVTGTDTGGIYRQKSVTMKKNFTIKEFVKVAKSDRFATPERSDYKDLEQKYWSNITRRPPIYGADVSGSITDPD